MLGPNERERDRERGREKSGKTETETKKECYRHLLIMFRLVRVVLCC